MHLSVNMIENKNHSSSSEFAAKNDRLRTHLGLPRDGCPVAALEVQLALADALQDHLGTVARTVGERRGSER